MKTSPSRFLTFVAFFCVALVALPPAFAMDLMERVITTQTQSIRREATEYQRKVAEANARAYMAAKVRALRQGESAAVATPKPHHRVDTEKELQRPPTDAEKHVLKKTLPRYIAVDTPKDKRSAPGTKKDVMIWDTQSEAIVGNNVYDVQDPPPVGAKVKFETYSAQYVGNGL